LGLKLCQSIEDVHPILGTNVIFNFDFLNSEQQDRDYNHLMQYLRQQHPEVLAQIAQSASPEVKQIISQNVQGLVGMLPTGDFNIKVTTDRENLAHLLASAMMTGYFLCQMEKRRDLEESLAGSSSLNNPSIDESPES
jgi:23S rRNA G2069 N7-methylase RlmK/C1962 C5-methylase RlmI